MGHDLSFPFNMVKRGWRAVYAAGARATEKMVPSIEGEFARKRRMMSHSWPIVLRGGMLSPRGYGPLYALMIASHRVLRYVDAVPPRGGARAERCPRRVAAPGRCTGSPSRLQVALRRRRAARPRRARAPAARRPLLRADAGLAGGRAVGLAAPRHAGRLGARGGHAVKRAMDVVIASGGLLLGGPVLARGDGGDPAREPGPPDLPPAAHRTRRPAVRPLQAPHDGARGRAHRRGDGGQRGRLAHHPRRRLPAPHLAGRAAEPRQRPARARCRSSARGRRSRSRWSSTPSASAGAWRCKPGDHRLGAGERARVAALVRAHRAGPLVRRAPLAATRPADPGPHGRDPAARRGPVQGGDRADGGDRRTPASCSTGVGQALRHRVGVRPARHRGGRRPQPAGARPVRGPRRAAPSRASTTPGTSPRWRRCAPSTPWAPWCR